MDELILRGLYYVCYFIDSERKERYGYLDV
ncbi:hypothetical protein STSP2_01761 [Anaerohalosphaera lusitana]|uniref:Uncharacterized protein n=1 Tax=Anaerohalosphaera lusitana TaxID=1936003 RepID=A0A1U9NKY0_9BACT|nr:hypothetical protein STSP2_01761 [Anaerohalosphaera lusitana]